jgi:TetR/AcrR family transcriptional repressor of mexJK operon
MNKTDTTREQAPGRRRAGRLASAGVIREAATTLFLRTGYVGTSMEEIATLAGVSKQTVYTHFADKERLFSDLIVGVTDSVGPFLDDLAATLRDTDDLEADLRQAARRYLAQVLRPEVVRMRRLLIAESGRFPELARTYYERTSGRTLATLASCFQRLAERGLLSLDDSDLAARHFAYLVLGAPLDRAMFCGDDELPLADLERQADAAARVFLAAYGPDTLPG